MKFSKKLLLTQIVALAATSAAYADSMPKMKQKENKQAETTSTMASPTQHSMSKPGFLKHVKSGFAALAPMVSVGVNGFGVNNELFLLSQKQNGSVQDGNLYVNGRLNVGGTWYGVSPKNKTHINLNNLNSNTGSNQSTILNPGLDLAFTFTKGWFTAFADLSTNAAAYFGSDSSYWEGSEFNTEGANPYTGLSVFDNRQLGNKLISPNETNIGVLQAYAMLGDLNKMPVYFLAGRKYVDFGSFANQDQTWQPLTNYFNQNVQNQLAVGFYQNGFHAAVTMFQAPWTTSDLNNREHTTYSNNHLSTVVATASYGDTVNKVGLHGGVSYTSNLNPNGALAYGYYKVVERVDGGIVFAEVNFNPITLTANYASAMKDASSSQGKSHAWDLGAKFDFNLMGRSNWVSANYSDLNPKITQTSSNYKLSQWLLGWHMQVTKHIDTTLQYAHQTFNTQPKVKYNVIALGTNAYF